MKWRALLILCLMSVGLAAATPVVYEQGRQEMQAKRYKRAIKYFTRNINLEPQYPYAYRERGTCYYYLKQLPEALDDYQAYLKLVPGDRVVQGYAAALTPKVKALIEARGFRWRTGFYGTWQTLNMGVYNSAFSAAGMEGGRVGSGWSGGISIQHGFFRRWLVGPEFEYLMAGSEIPAGAGLGPLAKANFNFHGLVLSLPITYQALAMEKPWRIGLGAAPTYIMGSGSHDYSTQIGGKWYGTSQQLKGFQALGFKVFATADHKMTRHTSLGLELGWRSLVVPAAEMNSSTTADPFFDNKSEGGHNMMKLKDGSPVPLDFGGVYARAALAFW